MDIELVKHTSRERAEMQNGSQAGMRSPQAPSYYSRLIRPEPDWREKDRERKREERGRLTNNRWPYGCCGEERITTMRKAEGQLMNQNSTGSMSWFHADQEEQDQG
jgi:hypothetical protein